MRRSKTRARRPVTALEAARLASDAVARARAEDGPDAWTNETLATYRDAFDGASAEDLRMFTIGAVLYGSVVFEALVAATGQNRDKLTQRLLELLE